MRSLLIGLALIAAVLFVARKKKATASTTAAPPSTSNTPPATAGTLPDAPSSGGPPANIPTSYDVPGVNFDPTAPSVATPNRDTDPVVAIAQAAGFDNAAVPVPTIAQANYSAAQGAATAAALAASGADPDSLAFLIAQSRAQNPYLQATGYWGDADQVAAQVKCGAQASGIPDGVLDKTFCRGGSHFGMNPAYSTGEITLAEVAS